MDASTIKPYVRKPHFYETDQMAIVHHSNYIRWFEEARVDFMEQVGYGYDKATEEGIDFAVTGVDCEYKGMVRFGETVHIRAWIAEISRSRMTVRYRVTNAATGKLCTTGESRHCYIDGKSGRPVSLQKALPELYDKFCALCQPEGPPV